MKTTKTTTNSSTTIAAICPTSGLGTLCSDELITVAGGSIADAVDKAKTIFRPPPTFPIPFPPFPQPRPFPLPRPFPNPFPMPFPKPFLQ
jgi:hypothetical protein